MNTTDSNTKLVDSYISLLKNMSVDNKLELISKLTHSVKTDHEYNHTAFYESFGSWDENESAD